MKRIGGMRRKTRHLLRKHYSKKGKISIQHFLQHFEVGDNVNLSAEPAYHRGMYDPRFYNRRGVIKRKRGACYDVEIKDGGLKKIVVVHPIHLKRC